MIVAVKWSIMIVDFRIENGLKSTKNSYYNNRVESWSVETVESRANSSDIKLKNFNPSASGQFTGQEVVKSYSVL